MAVRLITGRDNLHTVAAEQAKSLCVQCWQCGKRSALERSDKLEIHAANMEPLWRVRSKLKCQACGAKQPNLFIPTTRDDVAAFLSGAPVPAAGT